MTDALYWLTLSAIATAFFSFPYVVERIGRVGMMNALGYTNYGTGGFEQPDEHPATWAKRAHAAHRNAVESLPILAALVLTAHVTGIAGVLVATAAKTYFFARLAHYLFYLAGIPVVRTLAFFVALGALLAIGLALLGCI